MNKLFFLWTLTRFLMESITTLGLALSVCSLTIYCVYRRMAGSSTSLPGPMAWPILGNLLMISRAKDFYKLTKELQKKYGNVYKLQFGQLTIVFISGHKNITKFWIEDGDISTDRPDWLFCPRVITKQKGIIMANGHQYIELYKLIMQAQRGEFFQKNMELQLTEEINELCKCFSPDNAVDPLEHLRTSVLNVGAIMAFGKRFEYSDAEFKTLYARILYVFKHGQSLGRKETFFSWLAFFTKSQVREVIAENDKLHEYIREQLKDHKMEHSPKSPKDFLDFYLNLSEETRKDSALSEANMFQTIIDMFTGSIDSLTATLMIIVFYLLKYPDVQRKCREELHRVCKGKSTVTLEDRDQLLYNRSTIREVLRIAKPLVFSIYRTNKRDMEVDGYTIPAKSIILYDLNDPQIDPAVWENPLEFNPDRWTDRLTEPQTDGFLPFGTGERKCPGRIEAERSILLITTNILQKFELIPEDVNNLPMEREWTGVVLRPKPFKMFMKPVKY
ncbi:unnamed protein product [Mytilus edulis]|uniref:Cytochrome P450 n=2 Tax=Mytilus TaxID=6548 RepID=A0A8S3Q3U5_MYTED|nr:unnamed protein product [Mytilus edulis]